MKIIKPQKTNILYSSWEEWNAKDYLNTYFSKLGPDSFETLNFLVREFSKYKKGSVRKFLDFGSGPTIFEALPAANFAQEIHLSDYLQSNLDEVRNWLDDNPDSFNWN